MSQQFIYYKIQFCMQQLSSAAVGDVPLHSYQTPRVEEPSPKSLCSGNPQDDSESYPRPFLSQSNQKHSQSMIETVEEESLLVKNRVYSNVQQIKTAVWPEIHCIITKISQLQNQLSTQRIKNSRLSSKIEEYQIKVEHLQQQIKKHLSQLQQQNHNIQQSLSKIAQLEQLLKNKQEEINEKSITISEIQLIKIKKVAELDDKIKKLTNDQKEANEKLRKANTELQKQRKANQELKNEMLQKIEQMQSDKEMYLLKEVQNLKASLSSSKGQRQLKLAQEISDLKKKVYHLSEEIKIRNIQISLMERKKQQAVNDAIEKKDQEVKTQKSLYKSLQEKYAKAQQDTRNVRINAVSRQNQLVQDRRKIEEEVVLELSPDTRESVDTL